MLWWGITASKLSNDSPWATTGKNEKASTRNSPRINEMGCFNIFCLLQLYFLRNGRVSLNRFFPLYLSIKGQNHGLQPGIAFTVGVAAVGILPEFLAWCWWEGPYDCCLVLGRCLCRIGGYIQGKFIDWQSSFAGPLIGLCSDDGVCLTKN